MIELTHVLLFLVILGMLWLIYEVRLTYVAVIPVINSNIVQAASRL